jgi:hypothetical protein
VNNLWFTRLCTGTEDKEYNMYITVKDNRIPSGCTRYETELTTSTTYGNFLKKISFSYLQILYKEETRQFNEVSSVRKKLIGITSLPICLCD